MTDANQLPDEENTRTDDAFELGRARDKYALEVIFLGIVGLIVIAAFFDATSYDIVSSRTPFVIIVPLLGLIGLQALRLSRSEHRGHVRARISRAMSGQHLYFNKVFSIVLLSVGLMIAAIVFGHYVAIAVFIFVLSGVIAKEPMRLSLIVALVCTALIYLLFEVGFDIELYRGLIVRYFQGYRVF
jgi:hypothetical protein